jgi:hypothetical protein
VAQLIQECDFVLIKNSSVRPGGDQVGNLHYCIHTYSTYVLPYAENMPVIPREVHLTRLSENNTGTSPECLTASLRRCSTRFPAWSEVRNAPPRLRRRRPRDETRARPGDGKRYVLHVISYFHTKNLDEKVY